MGVVIDISGFNLLSIDQKESFYNEIEGLENTYLDEIDKYLNDILLNFSLAGKEILNFLGKRLARLSLIASMIISLPRL